MKTWKVDQYERINQMVRIELSYDCYSYAGLRALTSPYETKMSLSGDIFDNETGKMVVRDKVFRVFSSFKEAKRWNEERRTGEKRARVENYLLERSLRGTTDKKRKARGI